MNMNAPANKMRMRQMQEQQLDINGIPPCGIIPPPIPSVGNNPFGMMFVDARPSKRPAPPATSAPPGSLDMIPPAGGTAGGGGGGGDFLGGGDEGVDGLLLLTLKPRMCY